MTKDNVVNAALLTVGTSFTAGGIAFLSTNVWYAAIVVIVGFMAFGLREVLP